MLVNNETTLKMDFSKQQKGSLWINSFAEAERWLNEQENRGLNFDSIQWPKTKWTFVKFSSIEVKFVLDNQPMLVIGSLPDWLRNLAHRRILVCWIVLETSFVSGAALLVIKERATIGAHRPQENWHRVTTT